MALGFLGKLFKRSAPETPPPQRSAPPPPAGEAARAAPKILLRREEILDTRNRLCGYRLSAQAEGMPPVPEALFLDALRDAAIPDFARRRMAVIPVSPDAVAHGDHLMLAAPHATFLLDLRHVTLPPEVWLEHLRAIHASGSRTALAGVSLAPEEASLLAETDTVFLNLSDYALPQFQDMAKTLLDRAPSLELAAEGVHSWTERRMCAAWGFEYCLGGFLSSPDEEEKEQGIDQSRLVAIEMLNLLRGDASTAELAAIAKKDPGIAHQLLAFANSAAAALANPVASLEQAMVVLGGERMYRWLTVSMFRIGATRNRDEALLEVALSRARFLEIVAAPALPKPARDELFLVGLLSLFDILLAMPMDRILSKMNLAASVREVLLHSQGPLARYLMLALELEKGRLSRAVESAAQLGITPEKLESARREALAWAQEALGR